MASPALDALEHVVVVALENRSFDHLVGFLRQPDYPLDGLTGDEFNLETPDDPTSRRVPVSGDAPPGPDLSPSPGHAVNDVTVQLYGTPYVPSQPNAAHNNGFVFDYARVTGVAGRAADRIMRCHPPAQLPVLTTLAQQYAVCDHWHSSVPGPTWPNRLFLHAATSGGFVDNNLRDYRMRTIFENLSQAGRSWRIYFHDLPQALALANLRQSVSNFSLFDEQFAQDCATGRLPAYAFIEPRYYDFLWLKANDQHPPHSVLPGEHLLADIYDQLRASPVWNSTVLVITWDEHGGIYDHVLPPACVNPDGLKTPGFDFDRLGVRVPTVIVSPWVPPRTIDHTLYEHASVPAFLKRALGLPNYLTERDRQANSFESVLSLAAPRIDAPPLTRPEGGRPLLPVPGPLRQISAEHVLSAVAAGAPSTAPVSDLQASLTRLAHELGADDTPLLRTARLASRTATEHEAAVHVLSAAARYFGL